MKIVLIGSKESLAVFLKDFLKEKGHEVLILHKSPSKEGESSLDQLEKGGVEGYDVVVNFPEKYLLDHKRGTEFYRKEFIETRIKHTERLTAALQKSKNPPKTLITFSSVGYYPKEEERFFKESGDLGRDMTAELIKSWEDAACLGENSKIRTVVMRMGLVLSRDVGILSELLPLFRFGLGSVMGAGTEAFPWIYIKDLFWLILFFIENEEVSGVYNTVAPQLINSKMFTDALSQVMHKKAWLKLPKRYFQKKLGDAAEIVYAKSKIFPSRILKSGFGYRYPAIYPALVDALSGH